jgi:hypothetical protein
MNQFGESNEMGLEGDYASSSNRKRSAAKCKDNFSKQYPSEKQEDLVKIMNSINEIGVVFTRGRLLPQNFRGHQLVTKFRRAIHA